MIGIRFLFFQTLLILFSATELLAENYSCIYVPISNSVCLSFPITNQDDKNIRLTDVKASCGCITINKYPNNLPPHSTQNIYLSINSKSNHSTIKKANIYLVDGDEIIQTHPVKIFILSDDPMLLGDVLFDKYNAKTERDIVILGGKSINEINISSSVTTNSSFSLSDVSVFGSTNLLYKRNIHIKINNTASTVNDLFPCYLSIDSKNSLTLKRVCSH
jgi:Protein of unknown function (DUF1573)